MISLGVAIILCVASFTAGVAIVVALFAWVANEPQVSEADIQERQRRHKEYGKALGL
jgi:ABC-type nickel/cobalt efflux system permease component RcnA